MSSATQRAPEAFGRYLLDEEIARGGMARVYRARLRGLAGFEKTLVVKQIRPELASDPRFVELFVAEANTLVSLSHPNIVPVYELGVVDGVYFLAMEHVEGCTLSELLAGGPLDPVEAADVGAQVLDALGYAHERGGIVHRDVTPRNVLIDAMGHARLVDFGVAARVYANGADVFGSAGYMAPEQARGAVVTPRSDLFSAAAVVAELMTGRALFFRASAEESLRATLEDPMPDLATESAIPEELVAVLSGAIARDPEKRPHSAHEMARKLRTFAATHAPEGVASRLAERVSFALATRRETELAEAVSTNEAPTRDGRTMSIAASQVLTALTGEHTAPVSTTTVTTDDLVDPAGPTTRPAGAVGRRRASAADDSGGHARSVVADPANEIETKPQDPREVRFDSDARPAPATAPLPGRRGTPLAGAPALATIDPSPASGDASEPASSSGALPRPAALSTEPAAPRGRVSPWVAVAIGVAVAVPLALAIRAAGPGASTDPTADPRDGLGSGTQEPRIDAAAVTVAEGRRDAGATVPATVTDAAAAVVVAIVDASSSADASTREPPVAPIARGTIEVAALPWANVRIDGRSAGTAPIQGRSVAAGSHDVRASCPPLGVEARVRVSVPANGRVRVSFDLRQDPPVVRVR